MMSMAEQIKEQKLLVLAGERGDPQDHALRKRDITELQVLIGKLKRDAAAITTSLAAATAALDALSDAVAILDSEMIDPSFETVSKNIQSSNGSIAYDIDGRLEAVTYASGAIKTFAYDIDGNLSTITLTGTLPPGIDTVKHLNYSAGDLVGITYST